MIKKKIIESNHEDNEPQKYSSDESSSLDNLDDEAECANNIPNFNFTSDEDSQIGSRKRTYEFVFTFTSYLSTSVLIYKITNNMSHFLMCRCSYQ